VCDFFKGERKAGESFWLKRALDADARMVVLEGEAGIDVEVLRSLYVEAREKMVVRCEGVSREVVGFVLGGGLI